MCERGGGSPLHSLSIRRNGKVAIGRGNIALAVNSSYILILTRMQTQPGDPNKPRDRKGRRRTTREKLLQAANETAAMHGREVLIEMRHCQIKRTSMTEERAAILVQTQYRKLKAKRKVRVKMLWSNLKKEAQPLMKERVHQLRSVYDTSSLVENDGFMQNSRVLMGFQKQVIIMCLTPVIVVALWLGFPTAAYEEKFTDKHYVYFLLFWFVWMLSACFFFFSLFGLVISIPLKQQLAFSMLFSAVCVLIHVLIFVSKGGTTFVDTCLDASLLHFAVTVAGVAQFLLFVGFKIFTQVKHAEANIQTKQAQFVSQHIQDAVLHPEKKLGPQSLSSMNASMLDVRQANGFQAEIFNYADAGRGIDEMVSKEIRRLAPSQKRHKQRRKSMEVFDEHAKARISVASKTFLVQKLKQAMFTTLSAVWAAVLFWCLSIFSAFFVTHASDPSAKAVLTIVFYALCIVFEVVGLSLAEHADVIALSTQNPGHAVRQLRASNQYDNYYMWRLSHRMTVTFIAFKRSFYMLLFAEAVDLTSFIAMGFASLLVTIIIKVIASSQLLHFYISKVMTLRTYPSMGKEFMLRNQVDAFATLIFFLVFVLFFVIAKTTGNKHIYPYLQHSEKHWDLLGFLGMYTLFTLAGCSVFEKYLVHVVPDVDERVDLRVLFCLQDKKLYLSVVAILIHVGMDPYYSVSLTNLSRQLPCSDAIMGNGTSTTLR